MTATTADVTVGSGAYRYRLVPDWAKLPTGWEFKDVAAVAVDREDRVYAFSRGDRKLIVFDREGNVLSSWGESFFVRPHGLHIGPDDSIYCTDDGDHTVRKCTLDGKILLEIGVPGEGAPFMSGQPFNRCTHTALSPRGDIFVSDGYGNARIHKYTPDGKLLKSWGRCGSDPGEFNIPHNLCCDEDGWLYVADRENHRIQIFDVDGNYETQWNNLHRPCGLHLEPGKTGEMYVGELHPHAPVNRAFPNLGPRITILDKTGKRVGRVDETEGNLPKGQFTSPHGVSVDSHGDVYLAEVSYSVWNILNPGVPVPAGMRSLQKLVRI